MQSSTRWTAVAIWLVASTLAVAACLLHLSAARVGSEYVPMGNDSFYHARRILDTVQDPGSFYQFDAKIHVPEGSLLVWPWGYDYLMARAVRLGMAVGISSDPHKILFALPLATIPLAIGLLVLLGRRLSLTPWPLTLAALCLALNPTTRALFGFGAIDHHFAELLFILASVVTGLAWLQTGRRLAAAALGAVLGFALAIHNGLFIVQLPLLLTLFVRWQQGDGPPKQSTLVFIAALAVCSLAALLPSLPFRLGRFEFFTLSWFHFYIAVCTALFTALLAWLKPTRNNIIALVALGLVLLWPLLNEIRIAQSFLSGAMGNLESIQEMQAPLKLALAGNTAMVTYYYSFLIWLAPATFVLCLAQCWRDRRQPRLLFWIACVLGLVLLSTQLRMHYFGGFALYLPWLVVANDYAAGKAERSSRVFLIVTLLVLLAYVPQLRYSLITSGARAGDASFEQLHPMLLKLRDICARDPGPVLADTNAGHYIRYYTDCPVIANNLLLTEQHFRKAREVVDLFAAPAAELSQRAPYVKYVLVRAGGIAPKLSGGFEYSFFMGDKTPDMARTLLLSPPSSLAAQFTLLDEIDLLAAADSQTTLPYARLYRVRTAPSANEVSK